MNYGHRLYCIVRYIENNSKQFTTSFLQAGTVQIYRLILKGHLSWTQYLTQFKYVCVCVCDKFILFQFKTKFSQHYFSTCSA